MLPIRPGPRSYHYHLHHHHHTITYITATDAYNPTTITPAISISTTLQTRGGAFAAI